MGYVTTCGGVGNFTINSSAQSNDRSVDLVEKWVILANSSHGGGGKGEGGKG